jgi:hypothetical protein
MRFGLMTDFHNPLPERRSVSTYWLPFCNSFEQESQDALQAEKKWWSRRDFNPRPLRCEPAAYPRVTTAAEGHTP